MKTIVILIILAVFVGVGRGYIESLNLNWGDLFQMFIFLVLPGLLSLLGVLWLVGLLLKISKKLDE